MTSKVKEILENNYNLIWKDFLELQIKRSSEAVKLVGNANSYLVLQVIAWHNFLIVTENISRPDRSNIVNKWMKENLSKKNNRYKLTYTLISELTSLHLETVRRHVKKLEKLEWVKYSKDKGVEFNASEANNEKLTNDFNITETNLVLNFLNNVDKIRQNKESINE